MVSAGIDVEVGGADGRTALMNASGGAHAPVVERLLAAGASVQARSNAGRDALEYALMPDWAGLFRPTGTSELTRTVAKLVARGAVVSDQHLLWAVITHVPAVVEALVRRPLSASRVSRVIALAKTTPHEWAVDDAVFDVNCAALRRG